MQGQSPCRVRAEPETPRSGKNKKALKGLGEKQEFFPKSPINHFFLPVAEKSDPRSKQHLIDINSDLVLMLSEVKNE